MPLPADAIAAYLYAKDGNRPHLLRNAFTPDATLNIVVHGDGIAFPPVSNGREAIADALVRQFGQRFENVYTFCLSTPAAENDRAFHCDWLVAMTEKDNRTVRVGCGRYDWGFDPASGLAHALAIHIAHMQSLAPDSADSIMHWASRLPYPWCAPADALRTAPALPDLAHILAYMARPSA